MENTVLDDIDRFVDIMHPLAMISLFNKGGQQTASNILQYLALMRPNKVLPAIIERSRLAFSSVIEAHQTSSCIYALLNQICIMLQEPAWHFFSNFSDYFFVKQFQRIKLMMKFDFLYWTYSRI